MEHHPRPGFRDGDPAVPDRRNGAATASPRIDRPAPPEPSRADLLARVAALEGKLVTLTEIEQAKGALMVTYGISADAAFALLRFHSQNRNVKVRAIAAQLTTLMCNSPSSTSAITRFDRLLDDVALSLQPQPPPSTVGSAQIPATNAPGSTGWLPLEAADLPQVMLRAVATAPPGITIAGNAPDLPLVYANDAFTEMTGYPMMEIVGRNCRFLQGADTNPRDVSRLSQAIHAGRAATVVLRNYRSNGAPFWNEVSISPIRNRTDQVTHFIGTQIDITQRIDQQQTAAAGR